MTDIYCLLFINDLPFVFISFDSKREWKLFSFFLWGFETIVVGLLLDVKMLCCGWLLLIGVYTNYFSNPILAKNKSKKTLFCSLINFPSRLQLKILLNSQKHETIDCKKLIFKYSHFSIEIRIKISFKVFFSIILRKSHKSIKGPSSNSHHRFINKFLLLSN